MTVSPLARREVAPREGAFFTSSASFANPAVTIGRMFTDTFAGISPGSVPAFVAAQLVGAAIGAAQTELFHPRPGRVPELLDLPGPIHTPTLLED